MSPGFYWTYKLFSLAAISAITPLKVGFLPKGLRAAHLLTIPDILLLQYATKLQFRQYFTNLTL